MRGVEARAVLDRDEHVLEPVPLLPVVVHIASRDDTETEVLREVGEVAVAPRVAIDEVVLQLEEEVAVAKGPGVAPCRRLGLPVLPLRHQRRHLTAATAGERDQPLRMAGQRIQLNARLAPFVIQVRVREQATEVGVATLVLAEERQVVISLPVRVRQRDLGACDRPDAPGPCALGELHRAVQPVVVRQSQRRLPQLARPQHQLLDVRGAVEEREVGVAVQLCVAHPVYACLYQRSRATSR